MFKKYLVVALIVILCITIISAVEYNRSTNLRIKGWLFGDTTWTGLETVSNDSSYADTVAVSGIDTTCYVFATPIDSTFKAPLSIAISRNGDSIFVKCDSVLLNTYKYNWCVIRP